MATHRIATKALTATAAVAILGAGFAPVTANAAPASTASWAKLSTTSTAKKSANSARTQRLGVPASTRTKAVKIAASQKGVMYKWGGTSRKQGGYDCSGLMWYAYRTKLGKKIPRTAHQQYKASLPVNKWGGMAKGDLVFFFDKKGVAYHVGMYAGGGKMWESPRTGKPVRLAPISGRGPWKVGRVRR